MYGVLSYIIMCIALQVVEIAILLALMCKKSCESSELILYMDKTQKVIDLSQSGILANTTSLVNLAKSYNIADSTDPAHIPEKMLRGYLVDRKPVGIMIENLLRCWFRDYNMSWCDLEVVQ